MSEAYLCFGTARYGRREDANPPAKFANFTR